MTWDGFLDQLADWFERHDLHKPALRWVLGVSGGPDSTLLLHAMHELAKRRNLAWALHLAHLHHGIRTAEADADAAFVADLADKLHLPLEIEKVDVPGEVAQAGGTTEEVARKRRYDFLERVALKTACERVAVAHHADDDAETVLHRICRGTGLRGLAGMPEIRAIHPGSRVLLCRPLLHVRRAVLQGLVRERNIAHRTDSTNDNLDYTRGRIRATVMPMLREQINPNVTDALLRLAEQARWLGNYLEDAAARTFESLVVFEGPRLVALNTRALLSKQRVIQAEVVRRAIGMVVSGEQDVAFTHVDAVLRLAGDRGSGKEIHLPGPTLVRKVYDRLEFRPLNEADEPPDLAPVFLNCPGRTPLPQLEAEIVADFCEVGSHTIEELRHAANGYQEWLDAERVQLPLQVRGRRVGDRFWPLGAPGSKSVSDFFMERKVDPPLRARIGIVCDQLGPVWIMPLRIDERVKLRPTSRRAIRLTLNPAGNGAHSAAPR